MSKKAPSRPEGVYRGKDNYIHCIHLEQCGPAICFNCPYDKCYATQLPTTKENEFNEQFVSEMRKAHGTTVKGTKRR